MILVASPALGQQVVEIDIVAFVNTYMEIENIKNRSTPEAEKQVKLIAVGRRIAKKHEIAIEEKIHEVRLSGKSDKKGYSQAIVIVYGPGPNHKEVMICPE